MVWVKADIQFLVWVDTGQDWPLCNSLIYSEKSIDGSQSARKYANSDPLPTLGG